MDPSFHSAAPDADSDPAVDAILARAEQAVARAGERILVERLHRALDDEGSAALVSLSETLLPLLQSLVIVLPDAVASGVSPAMRVAAETLGAALRERGVALPALVDEGLRLHERLMQEIAANFRDSDRTLVMAVLRISRAILDMERAALLSYQEKADTALAHVALDDPLTGLASQTYFARRLEDELQRARRQERPLALVLIDTDPARPARAADNGHDPEEPTLAAGDGSSPQLFAMLLRRQLRGIDLAAYRGGRLFALLLVETGRDGASALLQRLRRDAAAQGALPRFSAAMAVSPDDGLTADTLLDRAEQELSRARRSLE
ncbi:MAG: GGDEF domain-containing protein [Chloroflexi bacterium]|nr:GGDEF domain-containing protein [Chloroflexota bacterium]